MSGYELRYIQQQENNNQQDNDNHKVVIIDGRNDSPSMKSEQAPRARPVDRYNLVFIILLIHGIGTLMPWNMFINAQDYFTNYKLASQPGQSNGTSDTSEEELAGLRKNFLSYLGVAAQLPNVIFNGLNLLVNMGSGNLKLRVNLTLAVELFIFALTIMLAYLDSSKWPVAFFYLTMASVVVLNMASGIYQNCIFGTGAKFPGTYTNAILIGSNLSGTFTSTVNLLSIWLAPEPQEAAIYYFITALVVIMICLISYNLLPKNSFFRYHDQLTGSDTETLNLDNTESQINCEVPATLRETVEAMVPRPVEKDDSSCMSDLNKKWQVFKKCWPQCLNVFLTFYVTLALFPAILANTGENQNYFGSKYYIPFACFFIFNLFAMIGNMISNWTTWPGKRYVWIIVVARMIFVPFFLFCNFNAKSRHWAVLIHSDIAYILGNILFAISSGYLSSLCMMFASNDLPADEAPKAGMLAAFFLVFGIFSGVYTSFFLTWIVELG